MSHPRLASAAATSGLRRVRTPPVVVDEQVDVAEGDLAVASEMEISVNER